MGFRGSRVQIPPSRLAQTSGPVASYAVGPLCFDESVGYVVGTLLCLLDRGLGGSKLGTYHLVEQDNTARYVGVGA